MKRHFGESVDGKVTTTPDAEKFSAYFNNDNGSGKVRGVYMQGNGAVRPIFRSWLKPFGDMGASTLTLQNTGGTDHLSFDAVGLPGFQFIQDPLEYDTRTHHSTMDVYERVQEEDLKQASVIMAAFAYQAAMRPDVVAIGPRHVDQHLDMILAAVEYGVRGIYIEKPFVRTLAEADEVIAAADEHGMAMVFTGMRHFRH
mgnify:CR=1 FL=1